MRSEVADCVNGKLNWALCMTYATMRKKRQLTVINEYAMYF